MARVPTLTAPGFIKSTAGSRFEAVFTVNDLNFNFTGTFDASVQPFVSDNATLTYMSITDLTSTRPFAGTIGTATISLQIANGVTINGPLDKPIFPASTVSGVGIWVENRDRRD